MLCEFELPSNPSRKVRLNEATVSDAMDFSAVKPEMEERCTTLFLNRVQDKDMYSDPKTWTGEDRRYALFQYYINTRRDKDIPLTWTCRRCGKVHTAGIPLIKILNDYTPIKGAAFREFPLNGHNVTVHPLLGSDLEYIEEFRYDLEVWKQRFVQGRDTLPSSEILRLESDLRMRQVRIDMLQVLCCLDMKYLDERGTPESRRRAVEETLLALPARDFYDLFNRMKEALEDMRHGLRTQYENGRYDIIIPDVPCETYPNEVEPLRYQFRASEVIPSI